jgi:tetratricopeptide (TPR) repeat protein
MICRTFAEAFPAAYLWFQGDYAKLIGAPSPLRIDFGELSRRLSTPAVRSSLAEVAMDDPVALVAGCALDREGLLALAGPGPTHTDDHPYVEFGGARLTKSQAAEILRLVAATVRQRNWTAANLLAPGSQDVTARVARRAEARVFYIEAREARFAADHEQEVRQYREALATDPDQGDVARDLRETADGLYAGMMSQADQARKRGDAQEARRLYMRLVGLFPDDPAVHSNLGMVLNQSDDANGALAAFDRALALDPMHPFAWAGKGMALNNLGRYDDAVAAYERALQAKPGDPKVLDLMGIAHSNAGRPAAALQCFRKAWWADPGNAEVKEHLRWAEAESGSTASGGGR